MLMTKNCKSKKFDSRYLCPETEGVNASSLYCSKEFNLFMLPVYFMRKTIHHFLVPFSEATAVLVWPCGPWGTFWPLLPKKFNELYESLGVSFTQKDTMNCIKLWENEKSFIGSKHYKGEFLVLFHRTV